MYGYSQLVVDVTPEKRYAIWDHKHQRFQNCDGNYGFTSKTQAEIAMGDHPSKNFYVVEWEIKEND